MHHTWDPKFRSGTKGYDYDTLPIKFPATTISQARGRGEFLEKEGKSLYKMVLEVMFQKNIVIELLFRNSCKEEGHNLLILKSN
jgi:hypothetical protein